MKKRILLVTLVAIALAAAVPAFAQVQVTTTGVNYGASTSQVFPLDQERMIITLTQMGVRVDDAGKGPFHNLSTDIRMIMYIDKNGARYHGYETHMDKDGDKVVWELWDLPGSGNKGKGKVIGATGKFAGMEGTVDFELQNPRAWPDGTGRTVCKEYMKLTLKNPL
jgi:hypothetical protein